MASAPAPDGLGEFQPELATGDELVVSDQRVQPIVLGIGGPDEFLAEHPTAWAIDDLWPELVAPALPGRRIFRERSRSFSHAGVKVRNVLRSLAAKRRWSSSITWAWIRPFTSGAAVGATTVFLLAEVPRQMRPTSAPLPSASMPFAFTTPPPVVREDRLVVATLPDSRPRLEAQRQVPDRRPAQATNAAPAVRDVPPFIGGMEITSAPKGARVFLDGQLAGVTPLVLDGLRIGSRAVRVEAEDHIVWSSSVRVVANERTRVHATLTHR